MEGGLMLVVLCTFTLANLSSATGTQKVVNGIHERVAITDLKEQIHDKIAYIAAIADHQHSNFIDSLKSNGKKNPQTEDEVLKLIRQHMINVTKTILPDLKVLIKMTDDRKQSAYEVNRHFAEDHVEPMLQAIFGEEKKHPKFYESLRKWIADSAQAHIRLVFEHY